MMKILGKVHINIYIFSSILFSSEYLIRINTESQFAFPMVRIKLIQDSALHVGSNIQGYIFIRFMYSFKYSFVYLE
jgi:hypothetical protein